MTAPTSGQSRNQAAKPPMSASARTAGVSIHEPHPQGGHGKLVALMNQRLSDAIDLSSQLKQAHWNVKGPNFIGLHELFDKIHTATETYVDQIAERIVQLGGIAEGTTRVAAARSLLSDYPLEIVDGIAHVDAVHRALATFRGEVRNTICEADDLGDGDTADLLTDMSRGLDQWLWFVGAHGQAAK